MLRCSKEAFTKCPTRHLCGNTGEATFVEGSECDKFNRQIMDSPMTNADRIRAMGDEELAEFIGHSSLCDRLQREATWCEEHAVCKDCLIEWLKQPAEMPE